jgi:MFS transporter, OPA family, sugar phosphate sensor protein UhpC
VVPGFLKPLPDAPPLDDVAKADRIFRDMRMRVLVALILVYGFFYTCRIGLSVVKKPLLDEGVFTATELGWIGASLLWGYALGKLVNGFLADRVNVARFITLGLALSAVCNLAMGANVLVLAACLLWAFNGLCQGVGAPASVVSLTHWFSGSERGRVYGIWSAAHSIGEGITFFGTSALVAAAGWRMGFFGPGAVCVIVAFAAAFVLKDRPQAYGLPPVWKWKREVHTDEVSSTRAAQLEVLKNPAIWICGISSALMYVTRYAVNNWGVLYLQEERGYSLIEAGSIVGVNAIAGFLGSAAYGFLSDITFKGRRPPATLLFGALEVLALGIIFYGPRNTVLLTAAFFVYGFTLSGILAVLGGLFAVDLSSKRAAGMAMGFIGFISYFGATAQDLISGYLIDAATTVVDGKKVIDFTLPVMGWVGCSVLSMLLAATLWRVKRRE